jgi:hypothetical protein
MSRVSQILRFAQKMTGRTLNTMKKDAISQLLTIFSTASATRKIIGSPNCGPRN